MDIVLDILVIHFEVENAVIQTELRVIDILRLQVKVTLFVMVLIVIADAVVQLTGRLTLLLKSRFSSTFPRDEESDGEGRMSE